MINKRRYIKVLASAAAALLLFVALYGCGALKDMENSQKTRIPTGQVSFMNATSPGNGKVYLNWGGAANATAYDVYRQITNSPAWPGNGTEIAPTNLTSYTDTVNPGIVNSAYYWVVPVDNTGLEGDFDTTLTPIAWIQLINGTATRSVIYNGTRLP